MLSPSTPRRASPSPLLCLAPAAPSGRRTLPTGFLRPPRALLCNNVSIRLPPGLFPLFHVPRRRLTDEAVPLPLLAADMVVDFDRPRAYGLYQ